MLKKGRYGIALSSASISRFVSPTVSVTKTEKFCLTWNKNTGLPTRVWRFLCFWVFKEARHTDLDSKKQFPIGTPMQYEGRFYHYSGGKEK